MVQLTSYLVRSPSHPPTSILEKALSMAGDAQRQNSFQETGKKLLTEYSDYDYMQLKAVR